MEERRLPVVLGQGAGARTVTLDLPPFTLVGATTRTGLLTTPLRDRFGVCHRLEHYDPGDLAQIVRRSAQHPRRPGRARGRGGDRRALARHPPGRQPAPEEGAGLRRGSRRRGRSTGEIAARGARDAGGRRRRARPPRPGDLSTRSRPSSRAGRWAFRPSPPRWMRSRTRSRTSTSHTCSSRA